MILWLPMRRRNQSRLPLVTREDSLWFHNRVPSNWAVSSINRSLGSLPVDKSYGVITGRNKWAIGWAEDDTTPGACGCTCWDLQLWVSRMFQNSADAARYGCEGMMAIHWRTSEITPTIMALAQAGWNINPGASLPQSGSRTSNDPGTTPATAVAPAELDTFWAEWGRQMFGGEAGIEAGRLLQKLDGKHFEMNSLFGAKTPCEKVPEMFAPLEEMGRLRPRIKGTGNLVRFDYWLNLMGATHIRTLTWRVADHLKEKIKEAKSIQDTVEQRRFVTEQIVPLRLSLARGYENTLSAYLNCVKTSGGLGTVSQIECGLRDRFFTNPDKEIVQMLGAPLPSEAGLNSAYRGEPRFFVPAKCSQRSAGEQQEILAFVLSGSKCTGVNLYWRSLGTGAFHKVAATHRARQAYRVDLPAQSTGAVEYYLEALLEDGQKTLWPATAPTMNQTVVTIE